MSHTGIDLQPLSPSAVLAGPSVVRENNNHSNGDNAKTNTFSPSVRSVEEQQRSIDASAATSMAEIVTFPPAEVDVVTSKSGMLVIIISTTLVTGIGSMLNGLVTVSLPDLSADLGLGKNVQLW